jgi:23S rRNA (uracil1939-C5)-methyltransferase
MSDLVVNISERNEDGRGRGRHGGRVVLVSQAEPGERVRVRVDRESRRTVQGRVGELVNTSAMELPQPCPQVFECTGCSMLRATEQSERDFKRAKVIDIVAKHGVAPELVAACESPSSTYGYRHYAKQRFFAHHGELRLGAYVAGTHEVASTRGCPVLEERLRSRLDEFVAGAAPESRVAQDGGLGLCHLMARISRSTGAVLWTVSTVGGEDLAAELLRRACREGDSGYLIAKQRDDNSLLAGELHHVVGATWIEDEIHGFSHAIGPRSFFQINPVAAERMVSIAADWLGEGCCLVEGYAGVGLFTLPMSKSFDRVWATELSQEAVSALRASAERYQRGGIECAAGPADPVLIEGMRTEQPDALLLDPPRKGLGEAVVAAAVASTAARVVLLACEPKSLAQDLPGFAAGGFTVRRVVPVDQFARTGHVEAMVLLQRD